MIQLFLVTEEKDSEVAYVIIWVAPQESAVTFNMDQPHLCDLAHRLDFCHSFSLLEWNADIVQT